MDSKYAITKHLPDVDFDQALAATVEALKREDFGILTEIDIKKTLKQKLDVEFPRYHILGACNPALAHRALSSEPALGLLLPCNVVVTERKEGGSTVAVIAPQEMFRVVDNPALNPIVSEIEAKLRRVIDQL